MFITMERSGVTEKVLPSQSGLREEVVEKPRLIDVKIPKTFHMTLVTRRNPLSTRSPGGLKIY